MGKIIILITFLFLIGCEQKDPYQKFSQQDHGPEWQPREFKCPHIPNEFTLGYFSNPSKQELNELCSCLERNMPKEKNLLTEMGSAINKCT